jgi:ribosome-binding protein aMBF1 (putative translation factor)
MAPHSPGSRVRRSAFPGFDAIAARRVLVDELSTARVERGLSQTEVAAQMGTSQSAVARLEAGDADVRLSTLQRYAAAVGVELQWSVEGCREP